MLTVVESKSSQFFKCKLWNVCFYCWINKSCFPFWKFSKYYNKLVQLLPKLSISWSARSLLVLQYSVFVMKDMVINEIFILIYFISLKFSENHSITIQRNKIDTFEIDDAGNCQSIYNGTWNTSTSCKCELFEKSILMSGDNEKYGCKGVEDIGTSCNFNLWMVNRKSSLAAYSLR